MSPALRADASRIYHAKATGVVVRALHHGTWVTVDIAHLDRESLLVWLRSRGGRNRLAEQLVLRLLGHQENTG